MWPWLPHKIHLGFLLLFCHFYLVSFLLTPTKHTKKINWRINNTIFLITLTINLVYLFRKKIFRQDWVWNWWHPLNNSTQLFLGKNKVLKFPADPTSPNKADTKASWQTQTPAHLSSSPAPRPPECPPLPDSCRQLNWNLQTIHASAVTKHDLKGEIPQCFAQPAQSTVKGNQVRWAR